MSIIIISHIPITSHVKIIYPNFLLLFIFYFLLLEETRISNILLILFGLINDYIEGTLIGITSLQLILLAIIIEKNYKALDEQKFGITWIAFAGSTTILYTLKIIVLSIYFKTFLFNVRILLELALTIACYPLVHFLFSKIFFIFRLTKYER